MRYNKILLGCLLFMSTSVFANKTIAIYATAEKGQGEARGTIEVSTTPYGLLFTPNLHDLSPGLHGFHLHEKPSCGMNGMDAGGHFDPKKTNHHFGPYNNDGHLGDLPAMYVAADGTATLPVVAPRIKDMKALSGHALMIHEGGDNYSDTPAKLGGGGARMECGVVS